MGCGVSNVAIHMSYSVKVAEAQEGETEVRRNLKSTQALLTIPENDIHTLQDAFQKKALQFKNKPCLGKYVGDNFEFMTYS